MNNNKSNKVELSIYTLTASYTLISGILAQLNNTSVFWNMSFAIGIATIIVEILFTLYKLNKNSNYIKSIIKYSELRHLDSILFPPQSKTLIDTYAEHVLRNKAIVNIKIICYGANQYGRLVEKIAEHYPHIKMEIVVCSPNNILIKNTRDQEVLKDEIASLRSYSNVEVHESKILPTLRASIYYTGDSRPQFCTIQPYYIFEGERHILRGETYTYSIWANYEKDKLLLDIEKIFMSEFNRLLNS